MLRGTELAFGVAQAAAQCRIKFRSVFHAKPRD
jgi:hypothetical protein